ncbi:hypothetical protein CVT24_002936 [Panaeolus cyanescens]|uniref:SAP domain-containing protein n=1 Tax=Panaeolus cyanescens TaxID=181874 RepID=A0A409WT25_9AGAR|nr:hypothetical protein CVT24_002936 [Panaeolus cyanescens]
MVHIIEPVSTMLKEELKDACRQLGLPDHGTVKNLRTRLRQFARSHQELAGNPDYSGLFPGRGRGRGRAPRHQSPSNTLSYVSSDHDDEYSEFNGIDPGILGRPPSPQPSSVHVDDRTSTNTRSNTGIQAWIEGVNEGSQASTPDAQHSEIVSPHHLSRSGVSRSHTLTQGRRSRSPSRDSHRDKVFHRNQSSTRIPGASLSNAAHPPPARFRQYLKNKWSHHIPLTELTDHACAREASGKSKSASEYTITFKSDGSILAPVQSTDSTSDIDEHRIPFDQWIEAWRRLLDMIDECLPPVEAAMWRAHHDRIFNDRTRSTRWPIWREYDITIRKRAVHNKIFDPSLLDEALYKEVERQHYADESRIALSASFADLSTTSQNTVASPAWSTENPCFYLNRLDPHLTPTDATDKASPTAFLGTVSNNGVTQPTARNDTLAHSAGTQPTMPRPAHLSDLSPFLPIVSPFIADAWERALTSANLHSEFADVIDGIRYGFDMGTSTIPHSSTYIPPNHSSATINPDAILNAIYSELSHGRYSGPFNPDRLSHIIGHFRSSPLGLVPKSDGTFRLIQDFSYPRNDPSTPSVNSYIDLSTFHCDWGTFQKMVDVIITSPTGTLVATMDVDSAFRRCPITPSQQRNFVVQWGDLCYIDHCAPFGAASSGFIFGRVADAFVAILHSRGISPVLNWVDDFAISVSPIPTSSEPSNLIYPYTTNLIHDIASELGWPWKPSKCTPFSNTFRYLGFLWNISNRTVEIPEDKKQKYTTKISSWISRGKSTRREAENILGTLVHCSLALPSGRSRLPSLTHFIATFNGTRSPFIRKAPPPSVTTDLDWWHSALSSTFCGSTLKSPPQPSNISFWVDASTDWGIGVVFNDRWIAWKLKDGWKCDGRNIGWAEFVAIELGLSVAISEGHTNTHFIIHSDNQGVIYSLTKGRSRSAQQNAVLKRIDRLCSVHAIWITCKYTPSSDNLADPPSRGTPPPNIPPLTTAVTIPVEILPFVS